MLKILRSKKTAKRIWIVLAILIIPAFCLWGFGSAFRSRKESVFVGKVFGKSISIQEYIKNYKAVRNQYLIQLGEEQFRKLEKYLNLETQVLNRIILLTEARRKKIKVINKEVVETIKQYPFFQSEGKFDPKLYKEIVAYFFHTSPRTFEEEIRDNLIIAGLYKEITNKISVSDNEIKQAYKKVNEQISLEYILSSPKDFLNQVSIETGEMLDYYNNDPEQFRKPLSYNLEYISVNNNDKQTIDNISQLLNQGLSLEDVAKDTNLEIKQTGFFNENEPIPQIGWSTEIPKVLSELKQEDEAWPQPVKMDTGIVYFLGLKERKGPYIPAFDDVKDGIEQSLRQEKANQIAKQELDACRKEVETRGLKKSGKKFNLNTGQTELFKRKDYVKELGNADIFFEAIQDLAEDQFSQILNITFGFCVVKLKERVEPDEEEFQQDKQEFANQLLEAKKEAYFSQFLSELRNKPNTFLKSINKNSP